MSLFDTIFQQIGHSSVQQLQDKLAMSGARLSPIVDKGIRVIAGGLSDVAQTEAGRQKLYESIRYVDDSVVDRPEDLFAGKTVSEVFAAGNSALSELIGDDARNQVSQSLASAVEIDQLQADRVVGYLAPEILGSLKREIDRGHVLDNPDGIGQLFFGNGDASSVSLSESPADDIPENTRPSVLKVRDASAERPATADRTFSHVTYPESNVPASAHASGSSERAGAANSARPPVVQPAAGATADSPAVADAAVSGTQSGVAAASGSAGIAQNASGERPALAARQSFDAGSSAQGAANSSVVVAQPDDGADWSWLFRFVLPVLLIGALMASGLRNCGGNMPSASVPLVADVDRSDTEIEAMASVESLRAELTATQESSQSKIAEGEARIAELEARVARGDEEKAAVLTQLEGVSTELEQVQGAVQNSAASDDRVATLEARVAEVDAEKAAALTQLEETSNELERLRGVEQKSAEMEALVSSISSERDSAANQLGLFQTQLEQSSGEKEAVLAELAELKGQLENAQAPDQSSTELKRELESMTAENNVNREAFRRVNMELVEAKESLAENADLMSRLEAVTAQSVAASEETERARAEIEVFRTDIETARVELENTGAELESARDELATLGSALESERSDLEAARAEVKSARAEVEATTAELDAANALVAESRADYEGKLQSSEVAQASFQSEIDRLKTLLEETVAASNRDLAVSETQSQQLLSGAAQDREELVAEISALQGVNTELAEQLDQYAVELAMITDTATEEQALLATAREQLAATQSELEQKVAVSVGFETKIQSLEAKLDSDKQSSSSDINRLTSVSNDLQRQLNLMAGARDDAQTGIAERDAQIDELATKTGELQVSLENSIADYEKSQSDNADLQQTVEELRASNDTMEAEIDQAVSASESSGLRISELEAELQRSGADIARLTAERDDLLNRFAQSDQAISKLNAERDELNAASSQLNRQIAELSGRLEQANLQNQDSQSRIGSLNASMTDVQSQLALSASDRDKYAKQTDLLAAETVRYQTEIKTLRDGRDQIAAQVASLNSELATIKNDADNAVSELAKSRETEAESTRMATVFKRNIDGLNKEIVRIKDEHAAALNDLNEKVKVMQTERDTAIADSETAQAQTATFADERSEMKRVIDDLQGSFDSAKNDVVSLTNRVSGLETEIQALGSARDSAVAEVAELRDTAAGSELRVVELSGLADGYKMQLEQAAEERRSEIESVNAVGAGISDSLNDVEVDDVEVTTRDSNTAVAITIGSGNLFRPGSADLSQEGSEVLAKVGGIVANYADWKIDVEGHTDNQPIGGALLERFPSNWELSVARASSAVRFLQLESGIDPSLLSARGFGETRPLDLNDSPDARRKNRRVEVVLRKK